MKKFLALLLAFLMIFALAACSKNETPEDENGGIEDFASENVFKNNDIGTFTYDVNKDGRYEITGYSTTSAVAHEITIPSSIDDVAVTGIADEAFKSCSTITNIIIPESVTYIGKLAFFGCDKLTKVTVPASVKEIGAGAFRNCTALAEVVLPAGVTVIEDNLFWDCTSLTKVNLTDSITAIGTGAFWNCDAIKDITLPASVTEIGATAFYGCDALAKITVPSSVTEIGEAAFSNIAAEKVEICGAEGSAVELFFNEVYATNKTEYSHYSFKNIG